MFSQAEPSTDSPATLRERATGTWRQVVKWLPNRLPSGRIEYAEAGVTWVLESAVEAGEDDVEMKEGAGIEETSSMESWYSDWEETQYSNSEDDRRAMKARGQQQLRELRAINEATRAARARGELDETGSLESWYESDTDDEGDETDEDDDMSEDSGDDDEKDEDGHNHKGGNEKSNDDNDDAEEPPGAHASVALTNIMDEPEQPNVLLQPSTSPCYLPVGEEKGDLVGEPAAPTTPAAQATASICKPLGKAVNGKDDPTQPSNFANPAHVFNSRNPKIRVRITPAYDPKTGGLLGYDYLVSHSLPAYPSYACPPYVYSVLDWLYKLPPSEAELTPLPTSDALSMFPKAPAIKDISAIGKHPSTNPLVARSSNNNTPLVARHVSLATATVADSATPITDDMVAKIAGMEHHPVQKAPQVQQIANTLSTTPTVRLPAPACVNFAMLSPVLTKLMTSVSQGAGKDVSETKLSKIDAGDEMRLRDKGEMKPNGETFEQHSNIKAGMRKRKSSVLADGDVASTTSGRKRRAVESITAN